MSDTLVSDTYEEIAKALHKICEPALLEEMQMEARNTWLRRMVKVYAKKLDELNAKPKSINNDIVITIRR